MPERPDLEYVVPILDRELRGRSIQSLAVRKPVVLRVALPGAPADLLGGRTFARVERRAHFVVFHLDGADAPLLVVSPMLAGRFELAEAGTRARRDLALTFELSDGRELRYRDDVQMGKVYVVPSGDAIPGFQAIGVDVLDPTAFTREAFRALARKRRDQAKVFLMDKSALDAMGNAYADEVLWEAGIHPKAMVRSLPDDRLDALHDAIVKVLSEARDTIARRAPALDEKVRDFLNVRGRRGQPCPRCGTTLRDAGVRGHDAQFCPTCQPDGRSTSLVDWRRLPGSG